MLQFVEALRGLYVNEETEAHTVVVEIADSGPGIAPEQLERIWEAFYTTKADGMGVGLSICRSIIESHGGRLWAAPNDGPGATFGFSIPRVPDP